MIKILFVLLPMIVFAQNKVNPCEKLSKINTLIQELHYKSKPIDDSMSVYVFDAFLEELDPDHRLFTAIEIKNLKKIYYTIDDSILEKNCDFISTFYTAYNVAIERYKTTLYEFKKTPFEFKSNETVQFSYKPLPYAKDEKELKYFFKKRILFNVLKDISEKSKNKDSLLAHFDKLSKESKDKTFEYYFCQYSKLKITEKDFISKFLNVFCSYFDPHSMYLSQSDKSSFLSNVSSDDFSFGMIVSLNEKDELLVDKVIPGSVAYFSEKIEDSDQIIKIKYLNEDYEIGCTAMDKIGEILSSSNYKSAEFTFRKKNGEIYAVNLTKKLMKIHENNVYSYILKKDNKKIGYIKIPSFYAIFENGKTNVSEDVAKEIYKLQAEKIEGLIIDLQNNGGGSMQETIQLIGSFIDIGPIAIMNKNKEKQIIKDPNRGSIYTGAMVVLINGFSASASELFANAMQDYQRAIIIGNQSYGKASMQQIFPLDADKNNDEFIKITTDKFYNITGKTNQYIGVTPDVEIPTLFNKQMPRENDSKTALKNNTIEGVIRFTKFIEPNRELAIEKSKENVKINENFKKISTLNQKINNLYENEMPPILLQFNSVFEFVSKMNLFWKEMKESTLIESGIEVQKNLVDVDYQKYDEFLKSTNIERIKDIKTNLHILEGCLIINNLTSSK
jgi:carboxyl-terminal processing protease